MLKEKATIYMAAFNLNLKRSLKNKGI